MDKPFYAFTDAERAYILALDAQIRDLHSRIQSAVNLITHQQELKGLYRIAPDVSGLAPIEDSVQP